LVSEYAFHISIPDLNPENNYNKIYILKRSGLDTNNLFKSNKKNLILIYIYIYIYI
jgi:hypothetical protein